jgi:hypothetical protein
MTRYLVLALFWWSAAISAVPQNPAPRLEKAGADRTANFGAYVTGTPTKRLWQHDRLILVEMRPTTRSAVSIFDRYGRFERAARFSNLGAFNVSLTGAALLRDETLVVSGGAVDSGERPFNFLGIAGRSGILDRFLNTRDFVPRELCSSGSTVWAYGWQRSAHDPGHEAESYFMLREFDLERGEIRKVLERKDIPRTRSRQQIEPVLRCTRDHVWIYFPTAGFLHRLDTSSKELTFWRVPAMHPWEIQLTGFEVLPSGEVFATMILDPRIEKRQYVLRRLERKADRAKWVPFGETIAKTEQLIGASGNELIFLRLNDYVATRRRVE